MILEKKIVALKNDVGLTAEFEEFLLLPQSNFPRLIFQDFMNQLKIPKIPIGFQLNTNQLIELYPNEFEMYEDTAKFNFTSKNTLNLQDGITYFLLTKLLHTTFSVQDVFVQYQAKNQLYFTPKTPFTKQDSTVNNVFIKKLLSALKTKQIDHVIERFFILLDGNYKNKLLIFLTYLDTKYNFKVNKIDFIEQTIGTKNMRNVKIQIEQILN